MTFTSGLLTDRCLVRRDVPPRASDESRRFVRTVKESSTGDVEPQRILILLNSAPPSMLEDTGNIPQYVADGIDRGGGTRERGVGAVTGTLGAVAL